MQNFYLVKVELQVVWFDWFNPLSYSNISRKHVL